MSSELAGSWVALTALAADAVVGTARSWRTTGHQATTVPAEVGTGLASEAEDGSVPGGSAVDQVGEDGDAEPAGDSVGQPDAGSVPEDEAPEAAVDVDAGLASEAEDGSVPGGSAVDQVGEDGDAEPAGDSVGQPDAGSVPADEAPEAAVDVGTGLAR